MIERILPRDACLDERKKESRGIKTKGVPDDETRFFCESIEIFHIGKGLAVKEVLNMPILRQRPPRQKILSDFRLMNELTICRLSSKLDAKDSPPDQKQSQRNLKKT
ncbi:MAG: hypothetical protein QNL24_03505 [Akkermansiaceae bacterium]